MGALEGESKGREILENGLIIKRECLMENEKGSQN